MTISLLAYLLIPLFSAVIIQFLAKNKLRFADIIGNVTLFAGLLNIAYLIFNPINFKLSFSNIAQSGFSMLMIFMIYLVAFCVSLFSAGFIPTGKNKHHFHSLLLVSVSAMCGIVTSADFFTLYIFVEALAVASFALIAFDDNEKGVEGSIKYFLLTFPASIFILLGMSVLLFTTGTFNFAALQNLVVSGYMPAPVIAGVSMIVLGFLIKSGAVPFHTWTPDAYQGAYSPVTAFLGGVVTKISGVYAIIKIAMIFKLFDMRLFKLSEAMMIIGALSILVGAIAAMRQKDFQRMLAFSSISQLGYIILACGLATPLAILGAIFHLFNHATFKTVLFLNGASLEKSIGTTNMHKMGGLEHSMPWTSWSSIVALMSTAGIPPLSGFWSKLIIIVALWEGGAKVFAAVALLASIITLAYFMVMQKKVFFGKITETAKKAKEMPALMLAPIVLLCFIIVASGILFPYFYSYLIEAVTRTIL